MKSMTNPLLQRRDWRIGGLLSVAFGVVEEGLIAFHNSLIFSRLFATKLADESRSFELWSPESTEQARDPVVSYMNQDIG